MQDRQDALGAQRPIKVDQNCELIPRTSKEKYSRFLRVVCVMLIC